MPSSQICQNVPFFLHVTTFGLVMKLPRFGNTVCKVEPKPTYFHISKLHHIDTLIYNKLSVKGKRMLNCHSKVYNANFTMQKRKFIPLPRF